MRRKPSDMSKYKLDPYHSAPLPNLANPNSTVDHHSTTAPPPPSLTPGSPNLTTTVYNTDLGLFSLTWSRNALGRSLHLHLLLHDPSAAATTLSPSSLSSIAFHLHIRPFIFWNKHGSKKIRITNSVNTQIYWDLSRAKFGSRPDPQSGFYIAIVVDGQLILLDGDLPAEALAKTKALKPKLSQTMVSRREHVYGNTLYTTKASFGGKIRTISIDCRVGDDQRLSFWIDQDMVLQIKHLRWKFRGNERIEVDGVYVQVSWDVYNWLFDDGQEDGYALFMFRFEKQGIEEENGDGLKLQQKNEMVWWSQQYCGFGFGFEKKKMKKSLLKGTKSMSSSSSLSSVSSGCSSVMEWASVEENELKGPSDFSLLVYAWKR